MSHISTLRLHQLRLGELPAEEEGQIRHHLADCDRCAARFDTQAVARQQFQAAPVPAWARPQRPWWQRWQAWSVALVPAFGFALFSLQSPPPPPAETPVQSDIRLKGDLPALEAWVQTGSSARPLYVGEGLRAGTRVQLKFNPGSHRFVTLAGKDSGGTVEVYGTLPAKGPGLQPAPFSLTLDNSKGQQTFYAILTDIRPDTQSIQSALTQDPVRVERAELTTVTIQKE